MSNPIRHKAVLPFCTLTVYRDYVICVMNEGITVLPEHNQVLIDIAQEYFESRDFVYITHRINSYSIDPTIYFKTAKIPNLKGFIIVDPKQKTMNTLKVEQLFFDKPFALFKKMNDALVFKNEILKDLKNI